jgi:hypothetical protein
MLNRPNGSRSTQSISFKNMIIKYGFTVYCYEDKLETMQKLLLNLKLDNYYDKIEVVRKPFDFL